MATHASIFLRLLTLLSVWMWNLIRVPLSLRTLLSIFRCLKQIAQRNRTIMFDMLTFDLYFLFIVLYTVARTFCVCALCIWICVWNRLRNWKYRGKRAGRLSKMKEARGAVSISPIVRPRTLKNTLAKQPTQKICKPGQPHTF